MCDCYTRWKSLYGQMCAVTLHHANIWQVPPPPPAYIQPSCCVNCHCRSVQAMPTRCCCTERPLPDDFCYDLSCLSIQSPKYKQPPNEKRKVKVMKKKNKGGNDSSSDDDSCLAIQSSSKCKQPLSEKRKVKVTKKKNKGCNDYSSDEDSCLAIQSLSKCKQPLSEKRKVKLTKKKNKGGSDYTSDEESCLAIQSLSKCKRYPMTKKNKGDRDSDDDPWNRPPNRRQSLSKYDEAYIKKKAKKMIKVSNYEDVSSDNSAIAPRSVYERILVEIRAILKEEEEKNESTGIPFKISEPYNVEGFNDSAVPVIKFDDDSTESTEYSETTESEAEDCEDQPSAHKD